VLLGSAGDIAGIQQEVQKDLDSIKQARNEFKKTFSSFKSRIDQASKAPARDAKRLKQKYYHLPKRLEKNQDGILLKLLDIEQEWIMIYLGLNLTPGIIGDGVKREQRRPLRKGYSDQIQEQVSRSI